jgi:alpha-ketoglutarate-dependent taurine dioxygenase
MAEPVEVFQPVSIPPASGPFALENDAEYASWSDRKLLETGRFRNTEAVEISDLGNPSDAEKSALARECHHTGMVFFRQAGRPIDAETARARLKAFANVFGLCDLESHRSAGGDGVVALEVTRAEHQRGYIPYTDKPLGWHTDGYYNYHGPQRMIRAMVLYCARAAETGGANSFLDHEIAYIRLRDQNPAHIDALMHPNAMTIPANQEADGSIRPDNTGPVFVIDPVTGSLAMRYTRRKRNIVWRDDDATHAAVAALERILDEDDHVITRRLEPGSGVLSNNVLHARSSFSDGDGAGRLFYRIRSYDRVAGT